MFWGPFWHPLDRPSGGAQGKSTALVQESTACSGVLFGILRIGHLDGPRKNLRRWCKIPPIFWGPFWHPLDRPVGGTQEKSTALARGSTAFSGVLFGIHGIGHLDGPRKNLRRWRKIPPHFLGSFLAAFGSAIWRDAGKIYGAGARFDCIFWGPFWRP